MASEHIYLGIDGGGTRTTAWAATAEGCVVARAKAGPANIRLMSDSELHRRFAGLASSLPSPCAVVAGLAGLRTQRDRLRAVRALQLAWPGARTDATSDLAIAFRAATASQLRQSRDRTAHVLVLSGTGSCCYGELPDGRPIKVGGWGHVLGDRGSAYETGILGLRGALAELDRSGRWPEMGARILRALTLGSPEALIGWVQRASKVEIAALAPEVFAAAANGDAAARRVTRQVTEALAEDARACAAKLGSGRPGRVLFHFAGGLLTGQRMLARDLARSLRQRCKDARSRVVRTAHAWGAVLLAQELGSDKQRSRAAGPSKPTGIPVRLPHSTGVPPTEQRSPRSTRLDRLSTRAALTLMLDDAREATQAVLAAERPLERLVLAAARTLRRGGRVIYVGAGTSGRLGVLDAAECPPTFQSNPEMVQGIIAGGASALTTAVEGAEDDVAAGAEAAAMRRLTKQDLVIGIAASGATPFVWGALQEARRRNAATGLIHCNPALAIPREIRPDTVVTLDSGPEILTGSTRLKAGTATKLALNAVTTLAFVRLGKTMSNLMVDLKPANEKLRERAVRIAAELSGVRPEAARQVLEAQGWSVRAAVKYLLNKRKRPRPPGGNRIKPASAAS